MVSPLTLFELLASMGLVYSTLLVRLSESRLRCTEQRELALPRVARS